MNMLAPQKTPLKLNIMLGKPILDEKRQRIRPLSLYLLIIAFIIELGLPARVVNYSWPSWYVLYAGDALWAMALFFFLSLFLDRFSTPKLALTTLLLAFAVEFSQLLQYPWLVNLRNTPPFGLLLGHGFLWSDLICYGTGVLTAAGAESLILRGHPLLPTRTKA